MAQYVYSMRGVTKMVPPKRVILKDINLSFFPGAKIGVLGINGSGKSSLLKIMAGVDKDFDGDAEPMPNLRVGFLPQEPQVDANKTVRETVEEGLGETADAKKKLDEIYAALIAGTQDLLAVTSAWFDKWILDGLIVRGLSSTTWGVGFVLRFLQVGNLQAYALLFGLGVIGLIYLVVFTK